MSVAFLAFMVPISQGIIVRLKEKYGDDSIIQIYLDKSYYKVFNIHLVINIIYSFVYWMFFCGFEEDIQCWLIIFNLYLFIVTIILLFKYLINVFRFSCGGTELAEEILNDLKACMDKK